MTARFKELIKREKGFTLIELLVVIGILAILLAITLIAINPAKQFSQSNNTKRRSDVNAILNAIDQYAADNKGALPSGINDTNQQIGAASPANPALDDLCASLVTKYLAAFPVDPLTTNGNPVLAPCPTTYLTNYWVFKSVADNRVTVSAPAAELGETISVTR